MENDKDVRKIRRTEKETTMSFPKEWEADYKDSIKVELIRKDVKKKIWTVRFLEKVEVEKV
jgi:hypothetical protein